MEKIAFQKQGNLYAASNGRKTLWIRKDHACGAWNVVEPWASRNPDGTFKSKHINSYPRLRNAKAAVTRMLTESDTKEVA
jgi:glucose-6-phosphate 1-dehydrogenase